MSNLQLCFLFLPFLTYFHLFLSYHSSVWWATYPINKPTNKSKQIHSTAVPRTAENFLALCASNYYDGCTFHRYLSYCVISKVQLWKSKWLVLFALRPNLQVRYCLLLHLSLFQLRNIKSFILQTGDPTNTGKGGASIWANSDNPKGHFPDEIVSGFKHNSRGILSMANSGANTNASQFFINYSEHGEFNGKYTVLGKWVSFLFYSSFQFRDLP